MLESIIIKMLEFIEEGKQSGYRKALRSAIRFDAELVPVVKNLENVRPTIDVLNQNKLSLVELSENILPGFYYSNRFKIRFLKAQRKFKRGFKGLALVSNGSVIGDIWYITWETTHHPRLHEHTDLLFLNPGEKDVYMYDMFIDPQERGRNLSTALMGLALYHLRQHGYKNAFGSFYVNNIPALWTHRMLKFTELEHVFFSRYLCKRSSWKKSDSPR